MPNEKLYRVTYKDKKEVTESYFSASDLTNLAFMVESFLNQHQEVIEITLLASELIELPHGDVIWLS